MTYSISNWALTQFGGQVVQALTEIDYIGTEKVSYEFRPGTTSIKDYKTASRSPSTSDASSGYLSVGSRSENAVTTTVDDETWVHEFIPYHALNTNGGQVPSYTASQLGRNLAERRMNTLVSAIGTMAITAGNEVDFDGSDTTGAEIYEGIAEATALLTRNKVSTLGRYGFLEPRQFYKLRKYAPSASRDFISGPDNGNIGKEGFMLFNTLFQPIVSVFDTDLSSNSDYATKYKTNFSDYLGLIWHPEALRVLEVEKPNGTLTDSAETQSVLAVARFQLGTGQMRTEAAMILSGRSS